MNDKPVSPGSAPTSAETAVPAVAQRGTPAHSSRSILRELATITLGVLIALSFENLVQWARDRTLVSHARETIGQEIADNRKEIELVLASTESRRKALASALQLANDLLANQASAVNELQLGFNLAELTDASWQTAGTSGALGHMNYGEVQRYADLYSVQALYADRQKGMMEHLAAAATMFSDKRDPHSASSDDVREFRRNVLAMQSDLMLEEQLARRLIEVYDRVLAATKEK
jgi:hypothetical protein